MMSCLEKNREHVLYWDQYLMNAELHGRWQAIPLEWNAGTRFFSSQLAWVTSSLAPAEIAAIRKNPKIIHFTTSDKPWLPYNLHPFRRQFFKTLDQTQWRGWRPVPQWRRSWFLTRVFLVAWVSRILPGRGQPGQS
jgi:lipopolysaccharide biosynthesis glycosyltransferase